MKFSENLQKMRKEAKLSQEALAEKLGVTRQSVSKWESGASYPEMDKLISMCSIFNCSMDYLLNGKENNENKKEEKFTVNNLVNEIVEGAEKTVKMLSEKDGREIIKFILEIIIIICIIMLFRIPVELLKSFGMGLFGNLGSIGEVFGTLWTIFIEIAYLILAILFFITIYKNRYLDNYQETNTIREEHLKNIETKEIVQKEKKEINKDKGIISFLASLLMIFVKFVAICILIGFAIECIFAIIMFAFSIIIFIEGVHMVGPIIGLLGLVLFSIVISELLLNFIANHKSNMKKIFISFVISFLLMGFGISMSLFSFSKMTYIDGLPKRYQPEKIEEEIKMNSELVFESYCNMPIQFIEDNNLTNIKIEMMGYKDLYNYNITNYDNKISIHYYNSLINGSEIVKEIIRDLKNNKIYNYNLTLENQIKVYASKENIEILKKNTDNYCKDLESDDSEIIIMENEIDNLSNENERLINENEKLKQEKNQLEIKNQELVDKITDALSS